jgi:hypothetical protein
VCVGQFRGTDDLGAAGLWPAVGDVLPNGSVKQQRVLQHEADLVAQRADREAPNIGSVDADGACQGIVLPLRAFPLLSLQMIEAAGLTPDPCVFDVGGGDSRVVDALVAKGLKCLAVLDASAPVPIVSFGPGTDARGWPS